MPARGAIVPHAPLLLEDAAPGSTSEVAHLRAAVAGLDLGEPDTLVLLSPHGAESGIYAHTSGSLANFGVRAVDVKRDVDAHLIDTLSSLWGRPVLEADCDHGIVVPLALGLGIDTKVVALTFAETTGPAAAPLEAVLEDAEGLLETLSLLAGQTGVGIVASVNTSAALSARAPMTERAEAQAIEAELLAALQSDVGASMALVTRLHREGWSCAGAPLAVLANLFAGRPAELAAYGAPFGVGYLVAQVT